MSGWAAAAKVASDLGSTVYSARQAEENQRRSISFSKKAGKNKYQWMTSDMRKAGLNPLLLFGSGHPGTGGAGVGAPGGPGNTNVSSAGAANRLAAKAEKIGDQELAKLRAETSFWSAQALKGDYDNTFNGLRAEYYRKNPHMVPFHVEGITGASLLNSAKSVNWNKVFSGTKNFGKK